MSESKEIIQILLKNSHCLQISLQKRNRFLEKIESAHVTYLFLTMGIIVVCVSITMVQLAMMEVCFDFYKFIGFLLVQLLHLCFLTMQGQFHFNFVLHWFTIISITLKGLYIVLLSIEEILDYLIFGIILYTSFQINEKNI
ncbi:hypothetical protein E2986_13453 [Frieseomelitta varia]|uniref:Uncharacterized protein n=1 Tax=Frieseomelitta varia TaxID=561572 RepID=A0A833SBD5_9HYME|nr:hypothetical protein E2986_13453 [Frieseomelitta varia]